MLNHFLFSCVILKLFQNKRNISFSLSVSLPFLLCHCLSPLRDSDSIQQCFQQAGLRAVHRACLPELCSAPSPITLLLTTWQFHLLVARFFPWMQESIIYKMVSGSEIPFGGAFYFVLICFGLISFTLTAHLLFLISLLPGAEETAELYPFPKDTAFNWMLIYKWLFPLWNVFIRGIFKCMLSFY